MIGKYRVESVIGEGGMGVVLKARHTELDEDVAIKCLLPEMLDRPEVVARFMREAKAAAKLKGEHIARVHDVGKLPDETPYIVMEYLDGSDLNAIIKHHGRQDPAIAVDLLLQACEALAEAHSIGIVHRDIKGSNLLITQAPDEPPQLKILDFGIATAPDGESDLTNASSVLGTPAYMAPEQISAARRADARSDIWALGIVFYELLEGKRPFRSDVYYDLCLMIRTEPPPALTRPDIPDGLEAVLHRCLAKSGDDRYQTCAELAFDLLPYASDPAVARATAEQCARLARRSGRTDRADGDTSNARLTPPSTFGASRPTTPSDRPATPHERTPAPKTPPPRTPVTRPAVPRAKTPAPIMVTAPVDTSASQPSTPTSISASSGQVAPHDSTPRLRQRNWILVTAIAAVIIVGTGIYVSTRDRSPSVITPATPTPEITTPRPEPSPPSVAPPSVAPPSVAPPTVAPATPKRPPIAPAKPEPEPKPRKKLPPPVVKLPATKPPPSKPSCQPRNQVNPFDTTPVCPN